MKLTLVRKLARQSDSQMLYHRAKEIGSLRLFSNDIDYTSVQIWYLHYLEVYAGLYQDIYMKKAHISEAIIDDDLRVDAYLLYRNKTENKTEEQKEKDILHDGALVFRSKPKGK